jgi:type I restriction enzyme S subunit
MSSNQEITELKELLNKALKRLYEKDISLIQRGANERAITSRFARYLEDLVSKSSFNSLDVDVEYNRNGSEPKRTNSSPNGTYPDVLLHKREFNNENKLVIEFKCYWSEANDLSDKNKLIDFTSSNDRYNYRLGAFVLLKEALDNVTVEYFENGTATSMQKGEEVTSFYLQEFTLDNLLERKNQVVNTTTEKVVYSDTGIPIIRANNISQGNLNFSDIVFVSAETFSKIKEPCKPKKGDVLYTNIGSQFGNAVKVTQNFDFGIAWNVMRLQPKALLDSSFLVYLLNNPVTKEFIRSLNSSSTMPFVSGKEIGKVTFQIPNIKVQKNISSLLSTLDDRITLLRETNATIEAIAQALFKSWFVDFDPVHAKAQGRQPEGMDEQTAALFPDRFVESELGMVPLGWEVSTIDETTALIIDYRGKTPKKLGYDWAISGIPAISAKNIKKGKLVQKQAMNYVSNNLFEVWMKDKLKSGDILMTSEAPLGELLYLANEHEFCLSQRVFALRANPTNCFSAFLYYWLSSQKVQERLAARATGTTVIGIRQSELRKIEVLLPPLSIQEKANNILNACLLKIEYNEFEQQTLADLRDTLLPRLISGQLRLPDVEA